MNKDQLIEDLKKMIRADRHSLLAQIDRGDRVAAHATVDRLIFDQRDLEDLLQDQK